MGYLKIPNLYKVEKDVLNHTGGNLVIMEKIHGTSAHIRLSRGNKPPLVFSGGCEHELFLNAVCTNEFYAAMASGAIDRVLDIASAIFDTDLDTITLYGEAYGGKLQGMSDIYGKTTKFSVFDVLLSKGRVDVKQPSAADVGIWLNPALASNIASEFGQEFVPWDLISTTNLSSFSLLSLLDKLAERPSQVSCDTAYPTPGEGIIIKLPSNSRLSEPRFIAKHKSKWYQERTRQPQRQADTHVESEAQAIADDWVTPMRLSHVLDKLRAPNHISSTPTVAAAVLKDVEDESTGEIVWTSKVKRAVKCKAAALYKEHLKCCTT